MIAKHDLLDRSIEFQDVTVLVESVFNAAVFYSMFLSTLCIPKLLSDNNFLVVVFFP